MASRTDENLVYIYDGTFPGLLSLLYQVIYNPIAPLSILKEYPKERDLFTNYIMFASNSDDSDSMLKIIKSKFSPGSFNKIIMAFISEAENIELLIYNFIKFGLKQGYDLNNFLTHEPVHSLNNVLNKITKEYHRMLGLIRFKKTSCNYYYSKISTDYNILNLISPHFANRMKNKYWIIEDEKRKIASIYKDYEWKIYDFNIEDKVRFDDEEEFFQNLWNEYFQTISIKERKNKKLQNQFIPKRYWSNLIEKNNIIKK